LQAETETTTVAETLSGAVAWDDKENRVAQRRVSTEPYDGPENRVAVADRRVAEPEDEPADTPSVAFTSSTATASETNAA